MKSIMIMALMLASNLVFAESYVIPADGRAYRIGYDTVTCGSSAPVRQEEVTCSAEPSGGLAYKGSGYNRREALNNLKRYCISKKQSIDPNYCDQIVEMAICN